MGVLRIAVSVAICGRLGSRAVRALLISVGGTLFAVTGELHAALSSVLNEMLANQ